MAERKRYPGDLTDEEWKKIEPLMPQRRTREGRPRKGSYREILNGIFYVLRTGIPWRMMPHDLPPWQTVYYYFWQWRRNGLWERILDALRQEERQTQGRERTPSGLIVDSQTVKTTEKGGLKSAMTVPRASKGGNAILL